MADTSTSTEEYPPRAQPFSENVLRAQQLCSEALGVDVDVEKQRDLLSVEGWSDRDVIPVRSARGTWIVKMPRVASKKAIVACREEGQRAQWAGSLGLGPKVAVVDDESGAFVLEMLEAHSLTTIETVKRLPDVTALLRKFHESKPAEALPLWNFYDHARSSIQEAQGSPNLSQEDKDLIEDTIKRAEAITSPVKLVTPCHNDFWGSNIICDKDGKLWCVDFEKAGMADPLWDVGYLALELEAIDPRYVARLYGLEDEESQLKVVAYCHAAKAWSAAWCASPFRHEGWQKFLPHYMDRLRSIPGQTYW